MYLYLKKKLIVYLFAFIKISIAQNIFAPKLLIPAYSNCIFELIVGRWLFVLHC